MSPPRSVLEPRVATACPREAGCAGVALLDLMFALAVGTTMAALAVPAHDELSDELRTMAAARYVAAEIASARVEAIKRSTSVAVRFEGGGEDPPFVSIADGNDNGVLSVDIRAGVDRPIGPSSRLGERFPGIRFGLLPDSVDIDGAPASGRGLRIGTAHMLSLSGDGTATPGTLYIRGRARQVAVRVAGATGRTRVLQYEPRSRTWRSR